jgi:hypothetical protein
MLAATLVCSDPACAFEELALDVTPEALERAACDCGCTLVAVAFLELQLVAPRGAGSNGATGQ